LTVYLIIRSGVNKITVCRKKFLKGYSMGLDGSNGEEEKFMPLLAGTPTINI
jgi:hypothetical protein